MWVVWTLIGWVGLCLALSSMENPIARVDRKRSRTR